MNYSNIAENVIAGLIIAVLVWARGWIGRKLTTQKANWLVVGASALVLVFLMLWKNGVLQAWWKNVAGLGVWMAEPVDFTLPRWVLLLLFPAFGAVVHSLVWVFTRWLRNNLREAAKEGWIAPEQLESLGLAPVIPKQYAQLDPMEVGVLRAFVDLGRSSARVDDLIRVLTVDEPPLDGDNAKDAFNRLEDRGYLWQSQGRERRMAGLEGSHFRDLSEHPEWVRSKSVPKIVVK